MLMHTRTIAHLKLKYIHKIQGYMLRCPRGACLQSTQQQLLTNNTPSQQTRALVTGSRDASISFVRQMI